jgi:protein required for attachment to host cells
LQWGARMNLNSLIIVADASRARLFRTAQTNVVAEPVELIEIDAIERPEARVGGSDPDEPFAPCSASASAAHHAEARDDAPLSGFAHEIAVRAARFAHYHFCNPVIVAAPGDVYTAIQAELARELPHVYTRSVIGDIAQLPSRQLMHDLQERGVFAAVRHPHQA